MNYLMACATVLLASQFIGCATITRGSHQTVPVVSEPPGAFVLVDGNTVGRTPVDVEMKRKNNHLVSIKMSGYKSQNFPVVRDNGRMIWGNILLGGLIGLGVDASTGAQYNLTPKSVSAVLVPLGEGEDQGAVQGGGADFVRKLDELDKLAEGKKISEEEYKTARKALFKEYHPEMGSGVDDPPDT